MITKSQIHESQRKWGDGIVKIGALKDNQSECLEFTSSFLNSLYDFENNDVLFKPTKAADEQFRPNFQMALSYFLGGSKSYCTEDEGFAMKPWLDVKFVNSGFIIENEKMQHIPQDGHPYIVNTYDKHTAMNCNPTQFDRIHIVGTIPEE